MARRRSKTSATGGNMDSLLDALTNVVGILVIVLVAVQLSSQDAARRIVEEYEKKISPEERVKAEEHAEEVVKDLKRVEKLIQREKKLQAGDPEKELEELTNELKKLEELAKKEAAAAEKKRQEAEAQKAEVMKEIEGLHNLLAELEEQTKKAEVQRAALTVERDETRAPKAPPVKEVRLPSPRPSYVFKRNSKGEIERKSFQRVDVLCRGDRVIPIPLKLTWKDNPDLKRWFERTLKSLKMAPDKDGWLIPNPTLYKSYEEMADAIVKESEEKPIKLRGCEDFEISMKRVGSDLRIVLTLQEDGGEKINRAASNSGDFNDLLKGLAKLAVEKQQFHYISYKVEPDAFETYLEIRNFTDTWTMPGIAVGWPAAWEPIPANPFQREYFTGVRAGERPPPPPPAPPSTTPPPKKPPVVLPNVLD